MNESKYKKWGWAAVIGLVGVILIAGFIVAGTMASPKPNKEEVAKTSAETTKESAENKDQKEENKGSEATKEETKTEESGRKEEQTAPVVETPVVEAPVAVNTNNAENLPTTGPESTLIATVMVGLVAYLLALNVNLLKKQN